MFALLCIMCLFVCFFSFVVAVVVTFLAYVFVWNFLDQLQSSIDSSLYSDYKGYDDTLYTP